MLRTCLFAALGLSVLAPRIADACSPETCSGGSLAPGNTGTVPANLPGLVWHPLLDRSKASPDAADPRKLTLTRSGDATPIAFTAHALPNQDLLLVPDAPLTVGETYEANDATVCGFDDRSFAHNRFSVRPAVARPTTLGTLLSSAQSIGGFEVATFTGGCTTFAMTAWREIRLAMDPGTDEWLDLLQVRAIVDDQPWTRTPAPVSGAPGTRQAGASVLVFRTCSFDTADADLGLTAGSHTIRMEATLPGTDIVVASDPITFDLDCEGHGGKDGGGCNASGRGSLWLVGLALGALVLGRRRRA